MVFKVVTRSRGKGRGPRNCQVQRQTRELWFPPGLPVGAGAEVVEWAQWPVLVNHRGGPAGSSLHCIALQFCLGNASFKALLLRHRLNCCLPPCKCSA